MPPSPLPQSLPPARDSATRVAIHACLCPGLCGRAEQYLREVWPAVTRALKEHGIACELNLVPPPRCTHLPAVFFPPWAACGQGLRRL